jgi:hypothetical protein
MTRQSRTLALSKKWYVSFVPVGRKEKRATRTFETENQAKAFALNILATGLLFVALIVNRRAVLTD